jgi:hypothetical protein
MPTFYQNDLAMGNTPDVTGGKPIVVCSQTVSDEMSLMSFMFKNDARSLVRWVTMWLSVKDVSKPRQ